MHLTVNFPTVFCRFDEIISSLFGSDATRVGRASAASGAQWHITQSSRRRWMHYSQMMEAASREDATGQASPTQARDIIQGSREAKRPRILQPDASCLGWGIHMEPEAGRHMGADITAADADADADVDDCLAYDTVGAVCVDAHGAAYL